MRKLRTLDQYEEDFFREHPEEIESYLTAIFDEFAADGNTPALLASLRVIAKVKGVSLIADEIGMTRQGLQKALSDKGNPRLESINSIMKAMGYRLVPEKIDMAHAGLK